MLWGLQPSCTAMHRQLGCEGRKYGQLQIPVQQLSGYCEGCEFHHVPRANNEAADALSKLGSTRQSIPPGVSLEHIKKPSITPSPESESIFISETDLEALRQAKLVQRMKIPTLKKQSNAQEAAGSASLASPDAADCGLGADD